jgi:hypothetical protein
MLLDVRATLIYSIIKAAGYTPEAFSPLRIGEGLLILTAPLLVTRSAFSPSGAVSAPCHQLLRRRPRRECLVVYWDAKGSAHNILKWGQRRLRQQARRTVRANVSEKHARAANKQTERGA